MTRKDRKLAVEVAPGRRFRHDGELLEEGDIVVLAAKEARQMVACGHCFPARMPMMDEDKGGSDDGPDDQDEDDGKAVEQTDPVPLPADQPPPPPKSDD
ncbi:hypothetical protein AD945_02405 [Gluconobacter albidus]|uniref:Uncharacterized protein n=1 Tax=Gluconobacter albidus TaxID=318683 RepID=A0A149TMC5_9PROT|nr:hypothetical protein [Gluconobacter albidus]KXV50229.1 hypothetical protein AD945_02405 [Gluconobacter albidus]